MAYKIHTLGFGCGCLASELFLQSLTWINLRMHHWDVNVCLGSPVVFWIPSGRFIRAWDLETSQVESFQRWLHRDRRTGVPSLYLQTSLVTCSLDFSPHHPRKRTLWSPPAAQSYLQFLISIPLGAEMQAGIYHGSFAAVLGYSLKKIFKFFLWIHKTKFTTLPVASDLVSVISQ